MQTLYGLHRSESDGSSELVFAFFDFERVREYLTEQQCSVGSTYTQPAKDLSTVVVDKDMDVTYFDGCIWGYVSLEIKELEFRQ